MIVKYVCPDCGYETTSEGWYMRHLCQPPAASASVSSPETAPERSIDDPEQVSEVMWEIANGFNRDAKADPDGHYALCISAGAKMIDRLRAEVASLSSSLREARADSERWRYLRQFLCVDRWEMSPASSLGAYMFKVPPIVGRSNATVEEIVDAARSSGATTRAEDALTRMSDGIAELVVRGIEENGQLYQAIGRRDGYLLAVIDISRFLTEHPQSSLIEIAEFLRQSAERATEEAKQFAARRATPPSREP